MYKLAGTWTHGGDVKAVKFAPHGILAAGRDGKLMLHQKKRSETVFEAGVFLNSLAVAGNTAYVGSQDAAIVATDLETKNQVYYLGHTANVCALDASDSMLVSGSWDKTARIWASPDSHVELAGHAEAVWAVLIVDSARVLTASADKTIVLWENGKKRHTFTGHTDAVRGLCLLDGGRFASCSNDYTIKIWSLDGTLLQSLESHTSFVYSVAFYKGLLFSTGEDRTLRVWRGNDLLQSIVLPGVSVWTVAVDKLGDVVVGSSDSKTRLFSSKQSHWLSDVELQTFEDEVASVSVGEDQVQIDESQVKDASILQSPGKEGQVVMVRVDGVVNAYQFSSAKWQLIGQVVSQGSQKSQHAGKSYDYVFDVDIADGVPPLKLPFNKGDNIYAAAEAFVENNELPVSYVGQVVEFLLRNTQTGESKPPAAQPATAKKAPENSVIATYSQPLLMVNVNKEALAKAFSEKAELQGSVKVDLLPLLSSLPASGGQLLEVAQEALSHWNPDNYLPALDALRLAVAYAEQVPNLAVFMTLLSCMDPAMPKYATLAARGLANAVARPDGRAIVQKNQQIFTEALGMLDGGVLSGPLALAAATLVLNLAVVDVGASIAHVSVRLTSLVADNDEAKYRLALAIGVQTCRHPSDVSTLSQSQQWLRSGTEARFAALSKEILPLFT